LADSLGNIHCEGNRVFLSSARWWSCWSRGDIRKASKNYLS